MPRRASLEPKRTTDPDFPWLVNLPPSLGANGRRERRYFKTRSQASEFCRQQRIRLENYGTASSILPAGKTEEALAAFEKVKPTGASLVEAVEFFVESFKRRASSVTFGELMQRTADAKSKLSAPYKAQIRQALSRFSPLNDRAAVEVTAAEIDEIANGAAASRRNGLLRIVRAAYNLGISKEWCRCDNPVRRLDFTKEKRNTTVLSNEQVSALLEACIETDFALVPYFLFTIFAGVRPEEVVRLGWEEHVDFDENHIVIADQHSKTKQRRIVDMEDLLIRWLSYYRASGGNTSGAVAPRNLRRRLRLVRQQAGIVDWPADAPRRTFASCHLAFFNKVDRLCLLLGHKSPTMLWEHYYKAVTKKRAAQFWGIEPPKSRRNIVSFAA